MDYRWNPIMKAMQAPIATLVGLLFTLISLSSCGLLDQEGTIQYEVRLRDGGTVPVAIRYRLPSGEIRKTNGTTPWQSNRLTFPHGTSMALSSETRSGLDSPLLCVLAGEGDAGEWSLRTIDEPLTSCDVSYEGGWPPNDLSGPLIRVG